MSRLVFRNLPTLQRREQPLDVLRAHLVLVMPRQVVFREPDAFPLDRVADEGGRLAGRGWNRGQGCAETRHVVTVDLPNAKTKGAPLVRERLEILHRRRAGVRLMLVVVDDDGE